MIRSWSSWAAGLSAVLAAAALVLLAAGPLGWRMGWLHYGVAFQSLLPWAGWVGIGAVATSAVAATIALADGGRVALLLAVLSLLAGGFAAYTPWSAGALRGVYPPINDITTDTNDPPEFAALRAPRKADGGSEGRYNAAFAAVQKKAYADIAPLVSALDPLAAFGPAASVAAAMPGWRIVASDANAGRIEATQSSRWFGFTDDIAIRVAPGKPAGSIIDIRSASRHGRGDFGVNANRIRTYLAALGANLGIHT